MSTPQPLEQSPALFFKSLASPEGQTCCACRLYPWLVKGVNSQEVTADPAGLFKEIQQGSKIKRRQLWYPYHQVGHTAIGMGEDGPWKSLVIYVRHT